jgi:predicted DNA-binding WGR domain protein
MTKRRFELVGHGSQKFWEIDLTNGAARYGRIGKPGVRGTNYSPREVNKKIREKLNKGYIEVTGIEAPYFRDGELVRFRTDEPDHIKKWLGHSDEAVASASASSGNMGTVVGIEHQNPVAPHWTIYRVLAGGAVRHCAGVYMQPIETS